MRQKHNTQEFKSRALLIHVFKSLSATPAADFRTRADNQSIGTFPKVLCNSRREFCMKSLREVKGDVLLSISARIKKEKSTQGGLEITQKLLKIIW